uniref:Uncharacterized protein n=1 Tax=Rhizophora mucronata TaxID=61149 RepID=A0A2P2IKV9_RHIMU
MNQWRPFWHLGIINHFTSPTWVDTSHALTIVGPQGTTALLKRQNGSSRAVSTLNTKHD